MNVLFIRWMAAGVLTAASVCAQAQAPSPAASEAAATTAAPAAAATPALPQAGETNAERARSQPGNNAPFWRGVRQSGEVAGVTNLPGVEKGVLIQRFERYPGSEYATAGEAWRQVRNRIILPYGGALLLIVLGALALFYLGKGTMGHVHPDGGRRIERFTPFERSAHWLNAIAFVLLGLSGLVMAFGKFVLLPWMGPAVFGTLTFGLKNLHNFAGPVFAVSLLVVILTFLKDNLPRAGDWKWIRKAGGLFSGKEVPSHRFNAGEKGIFWLGAFLLGLIVVASGMVLDQLLPQLEYTRGTMQVAHMFHAVAAVLMLCVFLGHIYIGTVGMHGAYQAMRTGYVNEGWAKEHHELWYDDIQAGKIPAQRSKAAAPVEHRAQPREA